MFYSLFVLFYLECNDSYSWTWLLVVLIAWTVVREASLLCSTRNPVAPRTAEHHLYVHLLVLQQPRRAGLHRALLWAYVAQSTARVLRHNHTNSFVPLSLSLHSAPQISVLIPSTCLLLSSRPLLSGKAPVSPSESTLQCLSSLKVTVLRWVVSNTWRPLPHLFCPVL